MITVISQTTAERREETRQLFLRLKPLMENGYTLSKAVKKELNIKHNAFYNQAWYKDLKKEWHYNEKEASASGNLVIEEGYELIDRLING